MNPLHHSEQAKMFAPAYTLLGQIRIKTASVILDRHTEMILFKLEYYLDFRCAGVSKYVVDRFLDHPENHRSDSRLITGNTGADLERDTDSRALLHLAKVMPQGRHQASFIQQRLATR